MKIADMNSATTVVVIKASLCILAQLKTMAKTTNDMKKIKENLSTINIRICSFPYCYFLLTTNSRNGHFNQYIAF